MFPSLRSGSNVGPISSEDCSAAEETTLYGVFSLAESKRCGGQEFKL